MFCFPFEVDAHYRDRISSSTFPSPAPGFVESSCSVNTRKLTRWPADPSTIGRGQRENGVNSIFQSSRTCRYTLQWNSVSEEGLRNTAWSTGKNTGLQDILKLDRVGSVFRGVGMTFLSMLLKVKAKKKHLNRFHYLFIFHGVKEDYSPR